VNNLGLLSCGNCKAKEAEEMYERALKGCEKELGPEHTSTLTIVNNLGPSEQQSRHADGGLKTRLSEH